MATNYRIKIGEIGLLTFIHRVGDQQFGYVRLAAPLLDLAGISTEFRGAIRTQF